MAVYWHGKAGLKDNFERPLLFENYCGPAPFDLLVVEQRQAACHQQPGRESTQQSLREAEIEEGVANEGVGGTKTDN